jgi:ribosomal protein S18 acetylase RimI-like enzyme
MTIEMLDAVDVVRELPTLVQLLRDAVDGGASVGFMPPLAADEATAYWRSVVAAVETGARIIAIARGDDGGIIGSAQLDLAAQANGRHRAEVQKVMVHSRARHRGVGGALMRAVEDEARALGRTTLVLDTRHGDPSERLYARVGYRCAGIIPRYARSADGALHATAFYYKLI